MPPDSTITDATPGRIVHSERALDTEAITSAKSLPHVNLTGNVRPHLSAISVAFGLIAQATWREVRSDGANAAPAGQYLAICRARSRDNGSER